MRWPADLLAPPADVHELVSALFLVHEAGHAVAAVVLGAPVVEIWARRPDHPGGVRFAEEFDLASRGDQAALIALAARPAVLRFLRKQHLDNDDNLAGVEPQFGQDEVDAERWARSPVDQLRVRARVLIDSHWSRVVAVADALGDAKGHLTGGPLAAALTTTP